MERPSSRKEQSNNEVKILLETETKGTFLLEVQRSALALQMPSALRHNIQEVYQIPAKCASINALTLFEKYLDNRNLNVYREQYAQTELLIGTLRLADFIGLTIFQETFISEIVVPSINSNNCISFLEETHKKLKNQENGSQCWYSLLNACITYLAQNLGDVYSKSEQKIKGLHEKILNEVLDRAIRNGSNDEEKIFELIMKSRKVTSVHSLCQTLRKSIMAKKINPKIHAKLSWKLQEVSTINEKKTKNFKFLQYEWMLSANRLPNNDLQVNLIFCGIDKKVIGSFYIKLMWWIDGKQEEKKDEEMKIHYLIMNKKHQLKVLTLTEDMQKQLGKSKVELSIFCCMDQIYTFTLNYIAKNSQRLNLEERQLTADELDILARLFKEKKEYVSSIRYLKYMSTVTPNVPSDIIESFPINQLGTYQLDFVQKMRSQKSICPSDVSSKNNLPSEISESNSVNSYSRKFQQRPESRGRLRKIFASSPSRSVEPSGPVRIQDINKITNLKNYFYDKNHPLYYQL